MIRHASLAANSPVHVAGVVAECMGGRAMPFPPCDGGWIAFSPDDDGVAVEVYPEGVTVRSGPEHIAFADDDRHWDATFAHLCVSTPRAAADLIAIGAREGWTTRICNRGPFDCVEMWLENRVLIEWLDPEMSAAYRAGMTMDNWAAMFGLDDDSSPEGEPE